MICKIIFVNLFRIKFLNKNQLKDIMFITLCLISLLIPIGLSSAGSRTELTVRNDVSYIYTIIVLNSTLQHNQSKWAIIAWLWMCARVYVRVWMFTERSKWVNVIHTMIYTRAHTNKCIWFTQSANFLLILFHWWEVV